MTMVDCLEMFGGITSISVSGVRDGCEAGPISHIGPIGPIGHIGYICEAGPIGPIGYICTPKVIRSMGRGEYQILFVTR